MGSRKGGSSPLSGPVRETETATGMRPGASWLVPRGLQMFRAELLLGLMALWAMPQVSSAKWHPSRRTCKCHGQDLPGLLEEHFAPRPKFLYSPYGLPLPPPPPPNPTCTGKPCCFPSAGQMKPKDDPADLVYLVEAVKRGRWTRGTAVVILYYAEWCPFSQALLPLAECLPMFFPPGELRFFVVKEQEVGLRTLIRLGIDSFPSLNIVMPQHMSEWGRSIPVQSRQLLEMVLEVEKTTGVEFCDMPLFNDMTKRATCPRNQLYSPAGQCPLIVRTDCQDGWGVRDWEHSHRCLALLKQEEPSPVYNGEDYLAWAALAFVILRFGGPAVVRWIRRKLQPAAAAAAAGGDGGAQPQQQRDQPPNAARGADADVPADGVGAAAGPDDPPREAGDAH